jgi:hypothetical protein
MRVLVACEFSGIVRDAFIAAGHNAQSCDFRPSETPGPHYQGNVYDLITEPWDMMIAFPPCTYLARSGARWHSGTLRQFDALQFVRDLMAVPIRHTVIENPIGAISSQVRRPDQIIQPWQFGHGETKSTCFWLKRVPKLQPTKVVSGRFQRTHFEPPGPNRERNRSRTYRGIAQAMAEQWTEEALSVFQH